VAYAPSRQVLNLGLYTSKFNLRHIYPVFYNSIHIPDKLFIYCVQAHNFIQENNVDSRPLYGGLKSTYDSYVNKLKFKEQHFPDHFWSK
jgi:hypothetical protein